MIDAGDKYIIELEINAGPEDWVPNILSIVFRDFTASEALAKLRDYEARKKAEDEAVKVGDEVTSERVRFIVTRIIGDKERYAGFSREGKYIEAFQRNVTKTGRHFPEIAAVLE